VQQLTGLDTQFLAMETETTMGHVASLAMLDPSTAPGGKLTLAELTAVLRERLHLLPPMTKKLQKVPFAIDRPYWVEDPHFDLGYHVRELALPAPGSDEQLAEQVARLHSRRLDRSRPLWEIYLISGLPDGQVALYTKLHHAAIDGVSGNEIISVLYDLEPGGRAIDPARELPDAEAPNALALFARGLARLPWHPVENARALPRILPHLDIVPALIGAPGSRAISRTVSRVRNAVEPGDNAVIERPAIRAPRVPFSRRISPHRRFAFGDVSLSDVKQIKNHFGVTVNDVVVSLTAGAVREWLLAHDALPERPVVAMVPVSVRTEEQMGTYGNRVSVMMVAIPTHLRDPVERLHATHETLRSAKERHNAMPASALQDVTNFIPPAVHARATRLMMGLAARPQVRPLCNLVVSNVPGSPIPIYLAGARMTAIYPVSAIANGTGLNVTIMSYLDRINIGAVADREQMPDLPVIVGAMSADVNALLAAAKPRPRPRSRSSKRT
jgi:diacylglycerol O-acyltransferase